MGGLSCVSGKWRARITEPDNLGARPGLAAFSLGSGWCWCMRREKRSILRLPSDHPVVFKDGIRVTDDLTLAAAGDVAARQRVQLERLLSMGLPNTPLKDAHIRVMAGNVLTARPIGIREGVDYLHSGTVRKIDAEGVQAILNNDAIALISPLGYSPAGELFSVSASDAAEAVAVAIGPTNSFSSTDMRGLKTRTAT